MNKEYHRQRSKEHYERDKDKNFERNRKRYHEHKAYIDGIKTASGCKSCKWNEHPEALDFHHLDPNEKDQSISTMLRLSKIRLDKEMAKCVILCARCHRLVHAGVLEI